MIAGSERITQWRADPCAFAEFIGLHLDARQNALLRFGMSGATPSKRRDKRELERIRRKIAARLRVVTAQGKEQP